MPTTCSNTSKVLSEGKKADEREFEVNSNQKYTITTESSLLLSREESTPPSNSDLFKQLRMKTTHLKSTLLGEAKIEKLKH